MENQTEDEYLFNFYAYNKTKDEIIVDPKLIYYKVYDEDRQPLSKRKQYAFDPERRIEALSEGIEDREDTHDAATGLNIVFSLISTIVDLTDDDDNDTEEVMENVAMFAGNQIGEEISKSKNIDGIFYLPISPDAAYIKIFVPLRDDVHTYKFKQIEE